MADPNITFTIKMVNQAKSVIADVTKDLKSMSGSVFSGTANSGVMAAAAQYNTSLKETKNIMGEVGSASAVLAQAHQKTAIAVGEASKKLEEHGQKYRGVMREFREGAAGFSSFSNMIKIGIGLLAGNELLNMADEYTRLTGKIQLQTDSEEMAVAVRKKLVDVSIRTHTTLATNVEIYERLREATKLYGKSQNETISLVQTLNDAFKVGGHSAEEAANATTRFAFALSSGRVRGLEFNQIMKESPALMKAMEADMGKPAGYIRAMIQQGKLGTKELLDEVIKVGPKMREEAAKLPMTIRDGLQDAKTAFFVFIGEVGAKMKTSEGIGNFFSRIAAGLRDPAFIQSVEKVAVYVGQVLNVMLTKAGDLFRYVSDNADLLKKAMIGLLAVFAIQKVDGLLNLFDALFRTGKTLPGVFGLIQKAVLSLLGVFEANPFILIIGGIAGLLVAFNGFKGTLDLVTQLWHDHRKAIIAVTAAIAGLLIWNALPGMLLGIAGGIVATTAKIIQLTAAISTMTAASFIARIKDVAAGFALVGEAALAAAPKVWALTLSLLANPFVWIPLLIAGAVAALVWFASTTFETASGVVKGWDIIRAAYAGAVAFISTVWKNTGIDKFVETLKYNWDQIKLTFSIFAPVFVNAIKQWLMAILMAIPIIGPIVALFLGYWDKIQSGTSSAWDGIVKVVKDHIRELISLIPLVGTVILAAYGAASSFGGDAGAAANKAYKDVLDQKVKDNNRETVRTEFQRKLAEDRARMAQEAMEKALNSHGPISALQPPKEGRQKKGPKDKGPGEIEEVEKYIRKMAEASEAARLLGEAEWIGPAAMRAQEVLNAQTKEELSTREKLKDVAEGTAKEALIHKAGAAAAHAEVMKQFDAEQKMYVGTRQKIIDIVQTTAEMHKSNAAILMAQGPAKTKYLFDLAVEVEYKKLMKEYSDKEIKDTKILIALKEQARGVITGKQNAESDKKALDEVAKIIEQSKTGAQKAAEAYDVMVQAVRRLADLGKFAGDQLKTVNQELRNMKPPENLIESLRTGFRNFALDFKMSYEKVAEGIKGIASNVSNAFVEMAATGKMNFKALALSVVQDLLRMIAKALLFKAIMGLMNAIVPGSSAALGLTGSLAGITTNLSGASGSSAVPSWLLAPQKHTGGIAGMHSDTMRMVSSSVFQDAVRHHTGGIAGLKSGEVPIIANAGEAIMPTVRLPDGSFGVKSTGGGRGNSVFAPNISVNIDASNNSGGGGGNNAMQTADHHKMSKMLEDELNTHLQRKLEQWQRPGGPLDRFRK